MTSAQYYMTWLAAALVLIAIASGIITWQMRQRETRHLRALELLDALSRYSEWVAAQGRVVFFQDDTQDVTDGALHEVRALQREWFPDLRHEAEQLVGVHRRLIDFLLSQRKLRMRDPEAWLESDQDAGYIQLWQQHCWAVQAIEVPLGRAQSGQGAGAGSASTA